MDKKITTKVVNTKPNKSLVSFVKSNERVRERKYHSNIKRALTYIAQKNLPIVLKQCPEQFSQFFNFIRKIEKISHQNYVEVYDYDRKESLNVTSVCTYRFPDQKPDEFTLFNLCFWFPHVFTINHAVNRLFGLNYDIFQKLYDNSDQKGKNVLKNNMLGICEECSNHSKYKQGKKGIKNVKISDKDKMNDSINDIPNNTDTNSNLPSVGSEPIPDSVNMFQPTTCYHNAPICDSPIDRMIGLPSLLNYLTDPTESPYTDPLLLRVLNRCKYYINMLSMEALLIPTQIHPSDDQEVVMLKKELLQVQQHALTTCINKALNDVYIKVLHDYNESKDLTQHLFGELIKCRGSGTIRDLYSEFGVDFDDME